MIVNVWFDDIFVIMNVNYLVQALSLTIVL